jgi:hypothetical protein
MGIAAYNRGTRAISRQIDQQLAETASARNWAAIQDQLGRERARVAELEARVATLAPDLDRARACIARLRLMREMEQQEAARRIETLNASVCAWVKSAMQFKRSWYKASQMIRDCMTPEQVQQVCHYRSPVTW